MVFRKTNLGVVIAATPDKAAKELLAQFSKKNGVFADVATHYGVAIQTVRRWVWTLDETYDKSGSGMSREIERIREVAIEVG